MANWITCEYHGASLNPALPNKGLPINDQPLNIELCESIKRINIAGVDPQLVFFFQNTEPVIWSFINEELRDLEFKRVLEKMKSKD